MSNGGTRLAMMTMQILLQRIVAELGIPQMGSAGKLSIVLGDRQ
jgi:hypothetical protein